MASQSAHPHHPSKLHLHLANPRCSNKPSFGLTFSRGWLVQIAQQTVKIAEKGHYYNRQGQLVDIKEALQESLEQSVHYHSSHTFHPEDLPPAQHPFEETEFHVCYGSSLKVAQKLQEQLKQNPNINDDIHIGILNSASGKQPDKFLRGTLSQEEGICRSSLLYPCLIQYYNRPHHFYCINHTPKYQDATSSCAIWSPHVPVIRDDSMRGDLLDQPLHCSFVSIPAPNAFALGAHTGDDDDDEEDTERSSLVPKAQTPGASLQGEPYETWTIQQAMHDRIFRALSIFALQGCTDLVLCAFGCGVHGNDPRQIALCFQELLSSPEFEGRFRTIVFTIHPSRQQNYDQFVKVFPPNDAKEEKDTEEEETTEEEDENQ